MMWCFEPGQLAEALEVFAEARLAAGHNPDAVTACVAGVTAFLRSPEARKLRVQRHEHEPTEVSAELAAGLGSVAGHVGAGVAGGAGEDPNGHGDCPHAAPFRYCPECAVDPCPIGLGGPAAEGVER